MAHAAGLSARVSVGRPGGRLRLLGLRALHVFVLTSLSIALPAFLVAGAHFFITRGSDEAADVLTAVAVIGLGPPVVLVALDALAELINARLGAAVHLVVVGFLAALFASQLLFPTDLGLELHLILAVLLGAAASVAYARTSGFRSFITALAPVPLLALAYLLLLSPVSRLVIPGEEAASAASTHSRTPVVVVVFDELPGYALMGSVGGSTRRASRPSAAWRAIRPGTATRPPRAATPSSRCPHSSPGATRPSTACPSPPITPAPSSPSSPGAIECTSRSRGPTSAPTGSAPAPRRAPSRATAARCWRRSRSCSDTSTCPTPRRLGIPSPRESSALSRSGPGADLHRGDRARVRA